MDAIRRASLFLGVAVLLTCCSGAEAATFPLNICGSSARDTGNIWLGDPGDGLFSTASPGFVATAQCPYNGPGLELLVPSGTVGYNTSAGFKVTAPTGIAINSIHVVNAYSQGIGANGWWGEFYWNGGPGPAGRSGAIADGPYNAGGCCSQRGLNSQSIGWFIACNQAHCSAGSGIDRGMGELQLLAGEARAPSITPIGSNNLWNQQGWVRGKWFASFTASDPSGVCGAAAVFGSLPAFLTLTPDTNPNRHSWKQCPDQRVDAFVDTSGSDGSSGLGEGAMQLRLTATNTANVTANPAKTVYVDNSTPSISLSGPADAPSTAGTQYVTATAGGSPSGISVISCSTDNGPAQSYSGPSAQVPVSGVGQHTVRCSAANNAVDPAGNHGWSSPASWSVRIGYPTRVWISFSKFVGLRCHSAFVRRHGHRVKVTRCRPRTVSRRTIVWVTVRRHHRLEKVRQVRVLRVVVPPHLVSKSVKRVPFGRSTKVSGWLVRTDGIALAGLPVQILAAPDDGSNRFTPTATVPTSATGTWTASLPAGPSRLIEAVYGGSGTTEPAVSAAARVIVPAHVILRVTPSRAAWGSRIGISGRILGGYIPANQTAVSQLLRLRIGVQGISQTAGIPDVTRDGHFRTSYCFNSGRGVAHFWFSVSTLNETDYPFAPSGSRRAGVTVGPGNAVRPC